MSDNATLVERLRQRWEEDDLCDEAATRIAELEAALRAAVLAEREACAAIAIGIVSDRDAGPYYREGWIECARELAIRIRARPTP